MSSQPESTELVLRRKRARRTAALVTLAAVGVLALQVVNLGRIISLLYLSRGSEHLFDFFHAYVWDAMIGLEGLLIFFFWTRWQGRQPAKAAAKETV